MAITSSQDLAQNTSGATPYEILDPSGSGSAERMGPDEMVVEREVNANIQQASADNRYLGFDFETGWISCNNRRKESLRLCWLPDVLRGHAYASYGPIFAIGALDGQMTVLDFAETLRMFENIGVLE
jgi:hypothetical protein